MSEQLEPDQNIQLASALRWLAGVAGAGLLLLSGLLLYFPPNSVTLEEDGAGKASKRVVSTSSSNTPAIALFAGGLGLMLYGMNGFRLVRLSAGGVTAETAAVGWEAKRFHDDATQETKEIQMSVPAPEPTEPPASIITTPQHENLAVYELKDVPSVVVRDALSNWPSSESLPGSLGDFEFATRRRGKGNHPWTLKFRGRKAVVVSYGGYGKSAATVGTATG